MTTRQNRGRLLLEVVVIIGSVLLAFGIEASWSAQQERGEFEALVALMRADIAANVSAFEARQARSETTIAGLRDLLLVGNGAIPQPQPDSMAALLVRVWEANQSRPWLASYEVASQSRVWAHVPSDIQVALAELLRPTSALSLTLQEDGMAALAEAAADYGGIPVLVGPLGAPEGYLPDGFQYGPDPYSGADFDGFVNDPRVKSWLSIRWGLERTWYDQREEWGRRLATIDEKLAAL